MQRSRDSRDMTAEFAQMVSLQSRLACSMPRFLAPTGVFANQRHSFLELIRYVSLCSVRFLTCLNLFTHGAKHFSSMVQLSTFVLRRDRDVANTGMRSTFVSATRYQRRAATIYPLCLSSCRIVPHGPSHSKV